MSCRLSLIVCVTLVFVAIRTVSAQPEATLTYETEFGAPGSEPGQFGVLRGISIGNNGEIILADAENERIQVCDISGECFVFGQHGTEPGDFNNPHGVAVDSANRIVTVETWNDRIQIFSPEGEYLQMFGTRGSGLGQFRIPGGVWVDSMDRILVADENNDRVQICSSDGQCKAFGQFGTAAGEFITPRAVAVDEAGQILVSERDNHRISICDETGNCTFFGGTLPGTGPGQFERPRELIPDGAGNIIIADGNNHRLQICTYDGDCLAFGEFGTGPGQFRFPIGVAMDDRSQLYVADQGNDRVQVFLYSAGFRINAGLNDAWYNPETSGQGFFFTVFEDLEKLFLAWFTYDTQRPSADSPSMLGEPGHRWITGLGPYVGNTASISLELTEGGVFDSPDPAVIQTPNYGTIEITFHDCSSATAVYDIPGAGRSGEIVLQRIVQSNVALCEALAAQ